MEKTVEWGILLSYYGDFLTARQRELFAQHVDQDLSLTEIAELAKISRQGVHDSIKRAQAQLREMENRLGLVRRTKETERGLSALALYVQSADIPAQEKENMRLRIAALQGIWEEDYGV